MEEKDAALKRFKAALREGRDQRKDDLAKAREEIHDELYSSRGMSIFEHESHITPMLNAASARGFLSSVDTEDRYGKETRVECAEAKLTEPYEKRPSVRAQKQARQMPFTCTHGGSKKKRNPVPRM